MKKQRLDIITLDEETLHEVSTYFCDTCAWFGTYTGETKCQKCRDRMATPTLWKEKGKK